MNPIAEFKKEHQEIEQELIELELIMNSEIINYPNLVHVFKKLYDLWDKHEKKEERVFLEIEKSRIKDHIKQMRAEHKILRVQQNSVIKAINSGNDAHVRKAMNDNISIMIEKLRGHMKYEDEILYKIVLLDIKIKNGFEKGFDNRVDF